MRGDKYSIFPASLFTPIEKHVIYQTCKQQVRSSILKTKKHKKYRTLFDIRDAFEKNNINEVHDFSSRYSYGGDMINAREDLMKMAMDTVESIKNEVNKNLNNANLGASVKNGETFNLLFTAKPKMFFFKDFVERLKNGLKSYEKGKIKSINVYPEKFGEIMRNIVLVITMYK